MRQACTLRGLRNHARRNADRRFDLDSCYDCLAAALTGKVMEGAGHFTDGTPVPPAFAEFTVACGYGSYTGAVLADALDKIIGGADPTLTGIDVKENHALPSA